MPRSRAASGRRVLACVVPSICFLPKTNMAVRQMIVADTDEQRREALCRFCPCRKMIFGRSSYYGGFACHGVPYRPAAARISAPRGVANRRPGRPMCGVVNLRPCVNGWKSCGYRTRAGGHEGAGWALPRRTSITCRYRPLWRRPVSCTGRGRSPPRDHGAACRACERASRLSNGIFRKPLSVSCVKSACVSTT